MTAARGIVLSWVRRSRTWAVILGLAGYAASVSPSLLPRSALMQGIVSGVSVAAWYAAGVVVDRAWSMVRAWLGLRITVEHTTRRRALVLGWFLLVVLLVPVLSWAGHRRQVSITHSMGMPRPPWTDAVVAVALTAAVFALLVVSWNAIRALFSLILRRLDRWPVALAAPLASVLVTAVVLAIVQYALIGGVLRFVGDRSAKENMTSPPGATAPTSALRSGGPGSLEAWETLGYEGRAFVSGATTMDQIRAATGEPAREPIRVYAARTDGRSIPDTVEAALAELDRTRAWDRPVVVLFTTTGLGWVNNWSASAIEYLTGGDCALVAVQHSVLPSPLALIEAPNRPTEMGIAMTDAIRSRLAAMPEGARPRFLVGGESLGAFGGNAAFPDRTALLEGVDGAVWTGAPSFTPLWRDITDSRVLGSTEVNPVIDNGAHIRFAAGPRELVADQFGRPLGAWGRPRVVYLQHPSDPVVWWSPSLLWRTPDWLDETRVGSPAAAMSWLPVVTFWQVTTDMPSATEVPSGFGHNYRAEVVPAWAAILDRSDQGLVERVTAAIEERAAAWE